MAQIRWRKLFGKTGFWITTEIYLGLIGLDDFADYSEFVFTQDLESNKKHHKTVKISKSSPQFCEKIKEYCPIPGTVIELPVLQKSQSYYLNSKILEHKCQKVRHFCTKYIYLENNIAV